MERTLPASGPAAPKAMYQPFSAGFGSKGKVAPRLRFPVPNATSHMRRFIARRSTI
jgi:hypothetical protein